MSTLIPTQTARFERKREAILEAAAALFNARGLAGATIADVAQAVGLTTTSVTYYYRKKEDLAAACMMRAIAAMDQILSAAEAGGDDDPRQRLARFLRLYFDHLAEMEEGRKAHLINFWDLRSMTGPSATAPLEAFVALFRRFRTLFQAPGSQVYTRTEQNARAHLVFAAVIGAKIWAPRYETDDYRRAGEKVVDVLINGLAGPGRMWRAQDFPLDRAPGLAEVSREAFLRAATELINDHGYRGASVDRISARLNVTKGSFYHHNATKDELVADCFERTFEIIRKAHRAAQSSGGEGWAKTTAMASTLVRHQLSDQGPLLRYSALSAAPAPMRARLLEASDRLTQRCAGLISDGIADGSIRPVDAGLAAQLIMSTINAAAELSKWAPATTTTTAADLFAKPLFIGVFSPAS